MITKVSTCAKLSRLPLIINNFLIETLHIKYYLFNQDDTGTLMNNTILSKFHESILGIHNDKDNDVDTVDTWIERIVIVHVRFQAPRMHFVELRHSVWDKFANFGGNFGIFAEITGCTFLGILNCIILLLKFVSSRVNCSKCTRKKKAKATQSSSKPNVIKN